MKSEKILEMLSENKIEELKQLLREEICVTGSSNKNITKAIIKLSKQAEKDQKQRGGHYIRPVLAGAYILNGKQCICNGCWGVMYDNITTGTTNVPNDLENYFDITKVIPSFDNREWFDIDIAELANKVKIFKAEHKDIEPSIKVKEFYYVAKNVCLLADTFENVKFSITDNGMMLLKGDNGKGIFLQLRIVGNAETHCVMEV